MEIWKDIAGYEGLYQVSNIGNVKSLERLEINSLGRKRTVKSKIMNQNKNGRYARIQLSKGNVRKKFSVHRLVAIAFLDKEEGKDYVNHIDGNKHNNKSTNLEWVTPKENAEHALENGYYKCLKPLKLIKDDEILEFKSFKDASNYLGCERTYITRALYRGKTHVKGYEIRVL